MSLKRIEVIKVKSFYGDSSKQVAKKSTHAKQVAKEVNKAKEGEGKRKIR